jgi:macrolide-specific efflux system membrane fusion protein
MSPAARNTRRWKGGMAIALLAAAIGVGVWSLRERIDYTTEVLVRRSVESTVTAIGSLQPRRYVDVGAQVSGLINRLHVKPGDEVRKGQLLVEIDPSVQQATVDAGRARLAGLRAQVNEQQALLRLAQQQLTRQRQMAADGATREEDLHIAEADFSAAGAKIDYLHAQIAQSQASQRAEEARLGYTRIYASMAGTVVSVDAREGQTLNATYQTPNILRVADLSGMTVWTDVSEADVRRVKPRMPVYFTTLGDDGQATARRWQGTVRQVLPAPPVAEAKSSASATPAPATKAVVYTVLFHVDNADGELMPQMTALVSFVTARAPDAVAVPLASLAENESEPGTYTARVLRADGQPETRQVRLGARSRHLAEVLEGLQEGDRLITAETRVGGRPRWIQW